MLVIQTLKNKKKIYLIFDSYCYCFSMKLINVIFIYIFTNIISQSNKLHILIHIIRLTYMMPSPYTLVGKNRPAGTFGGLIVNFINFNEMSFFIIIFYFKAKSSHG